MQQDKKRPKWFYVAACTISLGGLAAVTLVPALRGPVEFNPQLCLDYLGFLAVIWAAAFAADNLGELRAARLADFEPLIDVGVRRGFDDGQSQIVISLRNLGRGHAAGLRVSLYQQDLDQLVWIEDRLHDVPELVAPGEVLSPVRRKNDWVRYAVQKSVCDLIVEGSYRTPLGEERQLRRAFKLGAIESDLYEVPPPVRGDKGVKVERIRKLLTGIESAYDITATGHCLALDVDGEDLVVHLMGGDGAVMAWNFSFGTSLRRIEADVQRGTQRHLGGDGGEAVHTDDPLPSG